jgi:uncharacterized protein
MNRINPAIIVFIRNAELGKVKTRLAAELGAEETLRIYKKLLELTRAAVEPLPYSVYLYYSSFVDTQDSWDPVRFCKGVQQGEDLGARMANAFRAVFAAGHDSALIIGSDCPELDTRKLLYAAGLLDTHDAVVGPARDGGYYLLGLKRFIPEVFENMAWSTNTVFAETLVRLYDKGARAALLPVLRDIDTRADLEANPV